MMPRAVLVIFLVLGIVAVVTYIRRRSRPQSEFLWRIESIRASVLRDDDVFGQYLNLDQELRPDEGGWMNMKIAMPDHWQVESVAVKGERILLTLADGQRYFVGSDNVGELSFQVTDGGPGKSDEIVEKIWSACAHEGQT